MTREQINAYARAYNQRPGVREKRKKYAREYAQRPDRIAFRKEYENRPEIKEQRKEHKKIPEIKERKREIWNASYIKVHYGLTRESFKAMLDAQGGICAICGAANQGNRRLVVEHDHDTGKVRGLACGNCNTAAGLLGDSSSRADKLSAYLRKHGK